MAAEHYTHGHLKASLAHKNGRPALDIRACDILSVAEASFWSFVHFHVSEPCWLWCGQNSGGYGRFKVGRKRYAAHRLSYALSYGHCPAHLIVRHICDNPLCVAPHHLELGDDSDNCNDRVSRKRHAYGERSGSAILTDDAVREIRASTETARTLGERFGVGKSTVQKARQGANWKHVELSRKNPPGKHLR